MYYIVTGGAGFIGSNIVKALNAQGIDRIIVVDNLKQAAKFKNLVQCEIATYIDKNEFLERIHTNRLPQISAILHQGACSDTMCHDGVYMMKNNYDYTVELFRYCQTKQIQFIYASSAAVYGGGHIFTEDRRHENPLNIYGYSKFLFDQYYRRYMHHSQSQVVGLRYFNVYGINEFHKERMASVAFHNFNQFQEKGYVELFEGSHGYENGDQRRDFVSVEDVAKVNIHFLLNAPDISGIYNVGTGHSQPFNDVAAAVVNTIRQTQNAEKLSLEALQKAGLIRYRSFPESLKGKYQSFTQADISALRHEGNYHEPFMTVEEGVERYVMQLFENFSDYDKEKAIIKAAASI